MTQRYATSLFASSPAGRPLFGRPRVVPSRLCPLWAVPGRVVASLFIAVAAIGLLASSTAAGQEMRLIVTVDQPATVPIRQAPPAPDGPTGGPTDGPVGGQVGGPSHVVVTVTGFQPSPSGPLQALVTAKCGAADVEVGRFGLLPQTAFSAASDPSKVRRFRLAFSPAPRCDQPASLTIHLVPTQGDGKGGSLEIGGVALQ